MDKREELTAFLECADDMIKSNYILADVKIVNLLKSIAASETLVAVFKNCLADFDYEKAQKKYFIKNKFFDDRGEFVLPQTSRDLLALVFILLLDIDAKRVGFSEFLRKYFYEDGSRSAGYTAFINTMIKPFRNSVSALIESVIEGKIEDPIEAFTREEERRAKEQEEQRIAEEQSKELLKTEKGNYVKQILDYLVEDKTKIKASKLKPEIINELVYVIDMLANVVGSDDKDAINYAYISYKYCSKAYRFRYFRKARKIKALVDKIL